MSQRRCMGCMALTEKPVCEHCGCSAEVCNEPHQLPVGILLHERYQVGRVLGQGGFGITYLGWDTKQNIPLAIKEFFPGSFVSRNCEQSLTVYCFKTENRGMYASAMKRFLREAKALAQFEDVSAIVSIKDFFKENGTAYIVMEYVPGISLQKYVCNRGGRLTVEETLRLLEPVMEALQTVHRTGMIHRDISPDNIMLHPVRGAVLLDFGAVRTVNDADKYNPISESTDAVLKQGFAPIEQYQRRGSLGPWTDVYALCATICYCVTGAVIADAPMRAMETQVLDLSGATDITAGQIRALEQGLAVDLVRRTSSVEELRKALYVTDPGPDPGSGLLKRLRKLWVALRANWLRWMTRRGPGRGRKWVIAAAAVLVINLVMGIAGNIEGWVRRGDNYSYYRSFGSKLKDSWLEENGVFYHFDKQGNMDTRWCTIDGGRYYFGSDGIMRTGWQDIGGDRYYFDDNGEMCTGWRRIDGKMYYFADDGIMRTGNQVINGKTYVIGPDGVLEE